MTYLAYFTAFGERLDAGFRTAYTFAGDWGYRDDGDMVLLYIGARWYDPTVGRWTSADKWLGNIYQPLSLNRYLWGEDDPVNAVDPSGNLARWVHGIGVVLAAVGTVVGVVGTAIHAPVLIIGGGIAVAVGTLIWGYDDVAALYDKVKEWGRDIGKWLQDTLRRNPPPEFPIPMPT